jgi:hypothetical protein
LADELKKKLCAVSKNMDDIISGESQKTSINWIGQMMM